MLITFGRSRNYFVVKNKVDRQEFVSIKLPLINEEVWGRHLSFVLGTGGHIRGCSSSFYRSTPNGAAETSYCLRNVISQVSVQTVDEVEAEFQGSEGIMMS